MAVLIFCQPSVDAASHVLDAGEAVVEQHLHGLGGAPAGFAVDEDFTILRQAGQLVWQSFQRDQARALDAGDGVLLRLADVDEEAFEITG